MTSSDLTDTIQPNSDQLDAVDLLTGPRTFTITGVVVKKGAEQPVTITLAEFDRPWRPGLSMRRVLTSCWGGDGDAYIGRRVRLYCDPAVVFGGQAVGGTRIEALSHIDAPKKVPLLVSRGKSAIFVVKPLNDTPAPKPVAEPHAGIVKAFADLGVTVEQLERKVGQNRSEWMDGDVAALTAVGKKLRAGETTVDAEFAPADAWAAARGEA